MPGDLDGISRSTDMSSVTTLSVAWRANTVAVRTHLLMVSSRSEADFPMRDRSSTSWAKDEADWRQAIGAEPLDDRVVEILGDALTISARLMLLWRALRRALLMPTWTNWAIPITEVSGGVGLCQSRVLLR